MYKRQAIGLILNVSQSYSDEFITQEGEIITFGNQTYSIEKAYEVIKEEKDTEIYKPTNDEVRRINNILSLAYSFKIAERYLVGCLLLIKECKRVIVSKIRKARSKEIGGEDGKKLPY